MRPRAALLCLLLTLAAAALAEPAPRSGSQFQSPEIKALQADDFRNPGLLWVDEGALLYETRTGAANQSCRDCHVLAPATATTFPKINRHQGRLFNLTNQILHCRQDHQQAGPLDYESRTALALTTYLTYLARGLPFAVMETPLNDPLARGEDYFRLRRGQLNLSCANCHEQQVGRMLRGDQISQGQGNGYPAYRLEWQAVGSLHRRFRSCDLGVRAEPQALGGEVYTELELFLRSRAAGLPLESPAVRR